MRRPSLGLFTYSTSPRGSVVHAAYLAEAMSERGWEVTLYAHDKDGGRFFRDVPGVTVQLVPAAPTPPTTAELVKQRADELSLFMQDVAPLHDIYHAEDCLTANGLLAAREQGAFLEITRTVHHVERFSDPYLSACQERSIRQASQCLAVSRAAQQDVERSFGVRCARVSNGVSAARFARRNPERIAALRARFALGDDPVVLSVGGVEQRKNTLCTLRAFARVLSVVPRARLVVAGGATVLDHGVYRARYQTTLGSLPADVRARVHEIGVVPDEDVPSLFQLSRALAFPSLEEGFGLVALEALAAGLPVVASVLPPLTEFLTPEVATLVDPRSDVALAAGLLGAFSASSSRIATGVRHASQYSWERVAAMHEEAYRTVMTRPRRRWSLTAQEKNMPEMHFTIRWPDGEEARCYSPSLIVREYLQVGRDYPVDEFVGKSREMLNIASERVKAKYGYYCSAAMDQLASIEASAGRFTGSARVTVVGFEPKDAG